jgi:hypothetical protein
MQKIYQDGHIYIIYYNINNYGKFNFFIIKAQLCNMHRLCIVHNKKRCVKGDP